MARAKRKRHRTNRARRRVRHTRNPVARRRRRRVVRRNPVMRRHRKHRVNARRRHHRRNPGMSMKGIGGQVLEAAKHSAVILIASAATKKASAMVPVGGASVPITVAKQIAVGVVLAMVTRRFAPRFAGDVLIGAMLAPMGTLLASAPVVGPMLSGAPAGLGLYRNTVITAPKSLRGAPPGLGLYRNPPASRRLNSYVNAAAGGRGSYYD